MFYEKNARKEENSVSPANKPFTHHKLISYKRCFYPIQKVIDCILVDDCLQINIDLEHAVKILEGFEHHSEKGVGAFNLDGKMYVWIMQRKRYTVLILYDVGLICL